MTNARKNKKLHTRSITFQYRLGDWVLMTMRGTPTYDDKVKHVWQGPFKAIQVKGENVYEIENIRKKRYTCHAIRLMFYDTANMYGMTMWIIYFCYNGQVWRLIVSKVYREGKMAIFKC